ncbi:hypothetical protein RR48_00206, partial [Papilio machaon]
DFQRAFITKSGLIFNAMVGTYFISIMNTICLYDPYRTRYYQESQEGLYSGASLLLSWNLVANEQTATWIRRNSEATVAYRHPQMQMRCLPLINGEGDAQKEDISPSYASPLPPNPLPILSYLEKDAPHSSDETRNCFHLTPVFCVVVVLHRSTRPICAPNKYCYCEIYHC